MAGRTDYYGDVWEPMTLEHYAQGGFYCEVLTVRERGRIVGVEVGKRLTVEDAVAYRGTVRIYFAARCKSI